MNAIFGIRVPLQGLNFLGAALTQGDALGCHRLRRWRGKFKCPWVSDPEMISPEGASFDSPGRRPGWGNGPGAFGSTTPSPERATRFGRPTKDHFPGVGKMIERRLTSEEKKALKKPDTLEGA
jgi:hypothetical protein